MSTSTFRCAGRRSPRTESGVATAEWVVLAASIIGLGLGTFGPLLSDAIGRGAGESPGPDSARVQPKDAGTLSRVSGHGLADGQPGRDGGRDL